MQTFVWKIILIIALFISFIFFSFTVVASLQDRTLSFQPGPESGKKEHSPPSPAKDIRFYPAVPARLPDLTEGYLFNRERQLNPPENVDDTAAAGPLAIDMDEVRYAGSLINGSTRKGLIRYPEPVTPVNRGYRTRVTIAKRAVARKWSSRIVEEGETVSGYLVVSISPQAIVFEQGGSQIEKELYAPDKVRTAFTPPVNRSVPAKVTAVRSSTQRTSVRTGSTTRVRTPITTRATGRN